MLRDTFGADRMTVVEIGPMSCGRVVVAARFFLADSS